MTVINETVLTSSLDAMLVAVPAFIVLLAGVFRVDELIAAPRHPARVRRPSSGIDEDGRSMLFDPDGRPSGPFAARK